MRTVTAPGDIDRLFAGGRRVSHPALLVLVLPTPPAREPDGRVLFVAGTRLGNAVKRNRSKRVLREAARRAAAPWPGWDIALVARAGTGTVTPEELDSALARALKTTGVVR